MCLLWFFLFWQSRTKQGIYFPKHQIKGSYGFIKCKKPCNLKNCRVFCAPENQEQTAFRLVKREKLSFFGLAEGAFFVEVSAVVSISANRANGITYRQFGLGTGI